MANRKVLTGLDIDGNIIISGTVDGRDIATDGSTLDDHVALVEEHIDWTTDQGATNIHAGNYDSGSGATISDDTTTDATYYPTFATATSGSFTTAKISSSKLTFNPSTGQLSATDLNSLSDKRLKFDIKKLNINVINKLNPVSFRWKDTNIRAMGLIAQEVKEVIPEIVNTNDEGIMSISYVQLIPLLIKEIQDLKIEISKLKPSNPQEVENGSI